MTGASRLELPRDRILAHRRRVGALDERLPPGPASLRRAALVGLQDSMPRAALLSIHARVDGARPDTWEDPVLVQTWGPRFSAYVVAAEDLALFTLSRLPADAEDRRFAQDTADRLEAFLEGRRMSYAEAGHALGRNPNSLRYGAPTGRILIRWEGARRPLIWTVPAPEMDPAEARKELARRHLHGLGPTTPAAFGAWAGLRPPRAAAAFDAIADELLAVRTPTGEAWILAADETSFAAPVGRPAPARLLPSGDAYWLLQGADRELLVPDAERRPTLWTPRVWPGAVLVGGEIAGTWRRDGAKVEIQAWRRFSASEREAVEGEATGLPLPDVAGHIRIAWLD